MNPIRCLPLAALLALLCLSASPALGQAADPVGVAPAQFGLDGDANGRRFEPDPRFALPALYALWEEGDERALQPLLVDAPSPYAATRGLLIGLLSAGSGDFLRDYAFEGDAPDPNLSGPELTALLNAPLPQDALERLATSARVLSDPALVGAGAALEAREFARLALLNALRASGLRVRQWRALVAPVAALAHIAPARKEAFFPVWFPLRGAAGGSQLLSLVASDADVSETLKRRLLADELGVPAAEGFSSAQYGAMYAVLKALPAALRDALRGIAPFERLRSSGRNPISEVAGVYSFREIGLRASLDAASTAEVLAHELGHLAWDVALGFEARARFQRLHRESVAGTLDFVSDYAQTNAAEDYAETFEAYLQDTVGWIERSEEKPVLREKLRLVAGVLAPFIYETRAGIVGPQVRRASTLFRGDLPRIEGEINWELL